MGIPLTIFPWFGAGILWKHDEAKRVSVDHPFIYDNVENYWKNPKDLPIQLCKKSPLKIHST